ncbi:MAG TPA: hypothetical protein VJ798_08005 [Rhizomicrobium sp.]|nr:hypothetical protein [Rhizomicrobium sp.]
MNAEKDKWGRRSTYSLVMAIGAFFAFFNSRYHWVAPPEYNRIKGAWLEPILPILEPYLPFVVLALGAGFVGSAAYCLWRYIIAAKSGGPAA